MDAIFLLPVAAWISRGLPCTSSGRCCRIPVRLQIPALKRVRDALIQGTILAVDQFGNLITNLEAGRTCRCTSRILAGQREITSFPQNLWRRNSRGGDCCARLDRISGDCSERRVGRIGAWT